MFVHKNQKVFKNTYFEGSKCPTRVFEKLQKVLPGFFGKSRSYQGFLLPGFQNPKNNTGLIQAIGLIEYELTLSYVHVSLN